MVQRSHFGKNTQPRVRCAFGNVYFSKLSVSFKLIRRIEITNWLKCKSDQGPAPRIANPKSLLSSFCLSNCDEDVWVLLFLLPKVEEWFILSMTSWLCSAPHLRQDRWRKLEGLSAREWKILLFLSKGNSILQQQCTKEIKRLAFMLIRINTEIGFVRFQLFLFKAFFFYKHWVLNFQLFYSQYSEQISYFYCPANPYFPSKIKSQMILRWKKRCCGGREWFLLL